MTILNYSNLVGGLIIILNQNFQTSRDSKMIERMDKNLELMYVLAKAEILNEQIFRNKYLKKDNYEIEEILKKWEKNCEGLQHISLGLYKERFAHTEENMSKAYLKLKSQFFEKFHKLHERDQKIHLISLINDSIILRRKKQLELEELFPLYKLGIENGSILDQGKINQNVYVAIVTIGNQTKNYHFTKNFIQKFTPRLPNNTQYDAKKWANAYTAYELRELEECLDILQIEDFTIQTFKFLCRVLKLKAFFDKFLEDDIHLIYLFDYCNAFEKWILREKVNSIQIKRAYLQFIQKTRILAKIQSDVNFKEKELEDCLKDTKGIVALDWLLQKKERILNLKKKKGTHY